MKFRIFIVPITILAMSWFLFYSVPVSVAATPGANGLPCANGPDYRSRMQGPWDPARFDSDPVGIRYSPRWDIFYYAQCLDPATPGVLQTVLDKVIADGKITKPDCDGGKKITFDSEGNLQLCSDESDSYVGIRGSGANAYWIVGYYDTGGGDTPTPTPIPTPTPTPTVPTGPPTITGINPVKAVTGQAVEIYGKNLVESIKLESSDGKFYTVTGDVNNQRTTASFDVPSGLSAGIYKISVTGPLGSAVSPQNLEVTVGGSVFSSPVSPPIPTQGLPTDLGQLISQIFTWSLSILGIAVFVMFFYSGFLWLTAAGNTSKIGEARTHMTNAVFGAILLLSSYLILYTINPDFVKSTVNLPGLGTTSPTPSGGVEVPGQPIPAKSLLSDLQAERAKYGATITHEEAGKILNAVAWKNSADGWGLLSKSGGNNCPLNGTGQPISCDWLVHQPSLLGLDVFSDAPGIDESGNRVSGKASPGWGDGYPVEDSKWVAPVAP